MSDNASSEPSSALSNGDQSTKKEALRKAGAEYFDKVLARASAGKDPFIEAPKTRKKTQDEALDPDLETVGRVLEGARLYFVGSVYCISASLSLILLKVSLQALQTPGTQAFLHLLPTICTLWAFLNVAPLTNALALGVTPACVISAMQVLAIFGAVLYDDVLLVLGWMAWTPHVLKAVISYVQGVKLELKQVCLLGAGAAGGLLGCLAGTWPKPLGLLCLLGWSAGEGAALGWEYWKAHSDPAVLYIGEQATGIFRKFADEEAKLQPATRTFYSTALPAVPVLLIGLLCREGVELVEHELSVPAVSSIMLSVGAWASAAVSGQQLADALPQSGCTALRAAASVGTLVASVVMTGIGSMWALAAAAVVVLSGVAMQLSQIAELEGLSVATSSV